MTDSGLYVPREPMTFEFEGAQVFVGPNTVIRAGHSIMKGREDLFTPLVIHYDTPASEPVEPKTAKTVRK